MTLNYIDQTADLAEICQQLSNKDWIAIDTEFVRTQTYYPELSLVQIQAADTPAYLIDPLALGKDGKEALEPLWQLLTNPKVRKVFHSARQDIEVLYQLSGRMLKNLYDTQIAALFLGYGEGAGFAKLVQGELGVALSKNQTRTNWHQRPLSAEQLQYAADDVRYLAPLYKKIQNQLTPEQQSALQEDFNALLDPALYDITPEMAGAKLIEGRHFSPKQQAIILALSAWREAHAQQNNAPRRWVLKDDVILDLAKRPPKDIHNLYKHATIKPADIMSYGDEWIELIDYVFAHPDTWPEKKPKPPKLTPRQETLFQLLQAITLQLSQDYHIQTNRIASKSQLENLVRNLCPKEDMETPAKKTLIGWRHLLLETPFQKLCQNQASLQIKNGKLQLLEI
jgi:ribonuclease D